MVEATVELPGCTAERALAAFTDPELLSGWWGRGTLTTDLAPGGPYIVEFAALGHTMSGRVVRYEPGRSLEFIWGWAHEPDGPAETVAITVTDGEPTTLALRHGPHGDSEAERESRAEHRAGWEYFLLRLAAALSR
jgi:uncharacterized protein YndB with AHSA1/START domain